MSVWWPLNGCNREFNEMETSKVIEIPDVQYNYLTWKDYLKCVDAHKNIFKLNCLQKLCGMLLQNA